MTREYELSHIYTRVELELKIFDKSKTWSTSKKDIKKKRGQIKLAWFHNVLNWNQPVIFLDKIKIYTWMLIVVVYIYFLHVEKKMDHHS